ncbi:PAS domain S-box protein [Pontibacter sp. E15-1]|uniref:sensor histidine kinase n=1 Tax=Pontibacter sp. E15-1 TaxID=2919918 RepID=UPI001F4FA060|nr:PAS domain-containing sensor histidine kinase [Pontibacter sp. E15-1]MCJ8163363.1 PAS domain S-box protein [Pontibacter sp. E15-1]
MKENLDNMLQEMNVASFNLEAAMDGLWVLDIEEVNNSKVSENFWATLGYTSDDLAVQEPQLLDAILPEKLKLLVADFLQPRRSMTRDIELKGKFGASFWTRATGKLIYNETNTPTHIVVYHIDITDLKRQAQAMERCNAAAKVGYWEVDLPTSAVHWSKVTKEIHEVPEDYEPDLATALTFYDDEQSIRKINKVVARAIEHGTPYDVKVRIRTHQGRSRWVRAIGQTEFAEGKCTRLYGTFQDVNTEKVAKTALLQEKEKLQHVLQGTNAGTWEWNVQTGETVFNQRWAAIVGYTLEELSPISIQTWIDLCHPEDMELSNKLLNECFEKKSEYYNCECRMKHKQGHWIWVLDRGKITSWTNDGKPLMMFGTHVDITQSKTAEQALLEKQTLFETVLENINVGIVACNAEGELTLFNRATREFHGLPLQTIPPSEYQAHYSLYKSDGVTPLKKEEIPLLKTLWEGNLVEEEIVVAPRNKPAYTLSVQGTQLRQPDGKVLGAVVAMHDITERKQTLEQLRINEETFRGSFENTAVGMALLDAHGKWLKVNPSLCAMLGYTQRELLKTNFQQLTHPDDLDADLVLLSELIHGKRSYYHLEKRYFHKNGSIVYIILAVSMVKNEAGKPLYFVSQIVDITSQKQAEKTLEEAVSKMQSLLDASTQVSIIGMDVDGVITSFNKGAENLLGYGKDELLHQASADRLHVREELEQRSAELSAHRGQSIEGLQTLLAVADERGFETREWTLVRKDGSHFPVQLTVTGIRVQHQTVGYLAIATDISHIKKAEKEIQSLLDVTKDQNERLRNFAHIVSHNLRSHSGNIVMLLNLLFKKNPELAQLELIKLLSKASSNLEETIAHLNEVVQINLSVSDSVRGINLNEAAESGIKSIIALANEAGVTIFNDIDPSVTILGIPAYVDSILLNFLTNGIKYRADEADSFIRLSCAAENDFIALRIEDNGLGIDLSRHREKLFGMYKTFHDRPDSRGVGLFITKNQIEAMGGRVEVSSEVNKGTVFTIYLKHEKN